MMSSIHEDTGTMISQLNICLESHEQCSGTCCNSIDDSNCDMTINGNEYFFKIKAFFNLHCSINFFHRQNAQFHLHHKLRLS